jgi:hypothetical protein
LRRTSGMLRACGFYCFERAIPELASFAKISSDQKEIALQVLCPKGKVRKSTQIIPIGDTGIPFRFARSVAPSITVWKAVCVRTSFCVCSPTIWNGTCAKPLPRCSLVTMARAKRAKMSLVPRNHPRARPEKPEPKKRSTGPRFTLFKPYWLIYPPSFETPSPQILRALRLGNKKQNPRLFSKGR